MTLCQTTTLILFRFSCCSGQLFGHQKSPICVRIIFLPQVGSKVWPLPEIETTPSLREGVFFIRFVGRATTVRVSPLSSHLESLGPRRCPSQEDQQGRTHPLLCDRPDDSWSARTIGPALAASAGQPAADREPDQGRVACDRTRCRRRPVLGRAPSRVQGDARSERTGNAQAQPAHVVTNESRARTFGSSAQREEEARQCEPSTQEGRVNPPALPSYFRPDGNPLLRAKDVQVLRDLICNRSP